MLEAGWGGTAIEPEYQRGSQQLVPLNRQEQSEESVTGRVVVCSGIFGLCGVGNPASLGIVWKCKAARRPRIGKSESCPAKIHENETGKLCL